MDGLMRQYHMSIFFRVESPLQIEHEESMSNFKTK